MADERVEDRPLPEVGTRGEESLTRFALFDPNVLWSREVVETDHGFDIPGGIAQIRSRRCSRRRPDRSTSGKCQTRF